MKKWSLIDFGIHIAIVVMILVTSCSPMAYEDLSQSESLSIDRETYEIEATDNGDAITVKFKAISHAKSYGYGTETDEIVAFSNDELSFSNGYYTATIAKEKLQDSKPSVAATLGKKVDSKLSVVLFASAKGNGAGWIVIKSVDVELSLDNVVPTLYEVSREKDSVVLDAQSEALDGEMEYLVSYGSGKSVSFSSSELPYTMAGIGKESFEATVSHRFIGSTEYGPLKQKLSISMFDERQAEMDIKIDSSWYISVASDIPANPQKIGLFTKAGDTYAEVVSKPYSSTITFTAEELGSGFYASDLYVGAYNESIDEDTAVISQKVEYIRPLELKDAKATRTTYSAFIPVSDKLGITTDKITITGFNATITETEGGFKVSATGIESAKSYECSINIDVPGYRTVSDNFTVKTESFEGVYKWDCTADTSRTFIVNVRLNSEYPSSSSYKYKVFVNKDDPKNEAKTEYQIMPLLECSGTAPTINYDTGMSGNVDYKAVNEAYKWNYNKWKKSGGLADSAKLISWQIQSDKTTTSPEEYTTVVKSTANFIFDIVKETTSIFKFSETSEGNAILVFTNSGDNTVNSALYPNPIPYEGNEFSYKLDWISSL